MLMGNRDINKLRYSAEIHDETDHTHDDSSIPFWDLKAKSQRQYVRFLSRSLCVGASVRLLWPAGHLQAPYTATRPVLKPGKRPFNSVVLPCCLAVARYFAAKGLAATPANRVSGNHTLYIKMAQHLDARCVLLLDPSTVGAGVPNQNTSRIQHKEVYAPLYL